MGILGKLFGSASKNASGPAQWDAVISKCDLAMARDEIADMHRMLNAEAQKKGGKYCFKTEYATAWNTFRDNPTAASARILLSVAPQLLQYFEMCSSGSDFYEMSRHLKNRGL